MKTLLVRINLDIEEKDFERTLRFQVAVPIIKKLSKDNNRIVILTHKGRPKQYEEHLSMEPFTGALSKKVGKKVIFIPDINTAERKVKGAPGGTIFMLENLRFYPGENQNSLLFASKLAALGDEYINNDFATSHRKMSSLVAITKFIPSKMGEIIKNEVKFLSGAVRSPKHPFVLIIGGAKIKTKASTIKNLLQHADTVLLGGAVGNTFIKARGEDIGKSLYEPRMIRKIKKLAKNKKIITAVDNISERGAMLKCSSYFFGLPLWVKITILLLSFDSFLIIGTAT